MFAGIGGIAPLAMPFCEEYWAFVIVSVMFGSFLSAWCAVTSPAIVEMCGLELVHAQCAARLAGGQQRAVRLDLHRRDDATVHKSPLDGEWRGAHPNRSLVGRHERRARDAYPLRR